MTTTIATITRELSRLLDGEPARSMNSAELPNLLAAFARLDYPLDHAALGAATVELIINRCRSTLVAEKELAHMMGGPRLS
jgi:hypothetical protein